MDLKRKSRITGRDSERRDSEPLFPEREHYIEVLMLIAPASGAFATPLRDPLRDFGGRELVLLLFEGFGRSTHCTIQLSTRQKVGQRERVPYLVETTPKRQPAIDLRG
jgi:hypothetical protein